MRRFIRLVTAFVSLAGASVLALPTAHATSAAGSVTSTPLAPPAAVNGLTLKGVVSARDGGMYYGYQNASGNNYTLVKQKADGTFDTTFAGTGSATVTGLNVTGGAFTNRAFRLTSDLNGRWWAVSTSFGVTGPVAQVSTGTQTAATVATTEFTAAMLAPKCAAAFPTSTASSWGIQNVMILPKRTSGAWMSFLCSAQGGVEPSNATAVLPLKSDLTIDTSVTPIGMSAAWGATSTCILAAGAVADPTGAAGTPEMWVFRQMHNKQTGGICDLNGFTAAQVSGYDVLQISSTGSVSRFAIASAGDATDGQFSGRLDPGGRFIFSGASYADSSKLIMGRINANGTLDTTVGTNGYLTLSAGAAPAGALTVRATVAGLITTANSVYMAVQLFDSTQNNYSCQGSNQVTFGWRMALVSLTSGFVSSFGTNGVGSRVTITASESMGCTFYTGGSSVALDGTPRNITAASSGFTYNTWQTVADATGGSEGGTGTGGYTKDTGGAPSKGESTPTATTDNTVYAKLPATVGTNVAIQVLTSSQSKSQMLKSATPKTCLTLTTSIVTTATGKCLVRVLTKNDKATLRTLSTKVTTTATAVGTTLTASDPLQFSIVSWKISTASKAALTKLADTAKTASRVLIVGHSGMLYDTEAFNVNISVQRAAAVKAALQAAGVKTPISLVGIGSAAPLTTSKTESAQAKNRRVVLYFYP